jgi:tartrate dehydrogenase/decarboxylase/D-malate dehydrogenase
MKTHRLALIPRDGIGTKVTPAAVQNAIAAVFAGTPLRTPDLGGTATTDEFTKALVEAL